MVLRRPPTITNEHDELRLFVRTMAAFWDLRFPGPVSMAASLENVLSASARAGRRIPISGLRDAAHDMVVRSRQVSAGVIREADAYCKEHGAVTLSTMIERVADAVSRIVATERIATDAEFYIIRDILADTTDKRLVGTARRAAERLVNDYEQQSRKAKA